MQTEEYVQAIKDLLSKDPEKVRDANRRLFVASTRVDGARRVRNGAPTSTENREADLVLAQVGG